MARSQVVDGIACLEKSFWQLQKSAGQRLSESRRRYLLRQGACAKYWWIRHGTSDNHTSPTVITNLAINLEDRNMDVNALLYWDAGHGADEDPEDFIAWIGNITGFTGHIKAGK